MSRLACKHCGNEIRRQERRCPHCGIPLPAHKGMAAHQKFVLYFIALVIFCMVMILWLPPDWIRLR